uniref:Uncharacterized protein n=1 Tax=Oryza nivara TaxID=4536 RepID=A0A0E0IY35_ORYNI
MQDLTSHERLREWQLSAAGMADCRIGSSAAARGARWVVIGRGESWEVEWSGGEVVGRLGSCPHLVRGAATATIADASTNHNDSMSERTIPPPVSSHGEDFAEVVVVRHGETSANAFWC